MTANARAKIALQIKMYTYDVLPVPLATRLYRAKVSTALPLLLGVPRATARVTARARATRNR